MFKDALEKQKEPKPLTTETPEIYVSANEAFSEKEKRELADSLAKALQLEVGTATISEEALDLQPIISFVWDKITDAAFTLLLAKIGSKLWRVFQQRARETISKHAAPKGLRIEFKLNYDKTEIWLFARLKESSIVEQAFDGLKLVLLEIQYLKESNNLPGTKRIIQYEFMDGKRWQIAEATEMEPDFARYRYERPKWVELGRITAETIKHIQAREGKRHGEL